ncbi:hypothetical protein [Pseudooctadecabacter sp.]|uniref:hypothetical protein n=1 Tax=Pseudooctadecabacter sp. TaxID=1966338 RepID=UPI0025E6976D|nr:hypothetical protein [Pseudooctadecabacter sp.]
MKTMTAAFAGVLTLAALTAQAQEIDAEIDVNGDGFYSFPELGVALPDLTAEDFTAMDTTGDGLLDAAEVMAAQEAGLMPADE